MNTTIVGGVFESHPEPEPFVTPILSEEHAVYRRKRRTFFGQELASKDLDGNTGWAVFHQRKFEYQWHMRYRAWRRTSLPVSIFESPTPPIVSHQSSKRVYVGWGA